MRAPHPDVDLEALARRILAGELSDAEHRHYTDLIKRNPMPARELARARAVEIARYLVMGKIFGEDDEAAFTVVDGVSYRSNGSASLRPRRRWGWKKKLLRDANGLFGGVGRSWAFKIERQHRRSVVFPAPEIAPDQLCSGRSGSASLPESTRRTK